MYILFYFKAAPIVSNQSNIKTTVKEILISWQQTPFCEVEQLTSLLEYSHEEDTKPIK